MANIGSTWNRWDLHVHTASSYDSKYKGDDCDTRLVKAWSDHGISAVAITDHGVIDELRIKRLRRIISDKNMDITVFPGVELRTDTASANLHVIGVFSEKTDLSTLAEDFRAFSRQHKISLNLQSSYVPLPDIVEFVREEHHGLISVHDGKKSNGLGKAAGLSGSEDDPNREFKTLLRHDFRSKVDFLDTNSQQSAEALVKYTCHDDLKDLPVTVNSDVHTPFEYESRSVTWMKAKLTFDGLKEVFSQPKSRISFKIKPDEIQSQEMRKHETISKLSIRSDDNQNDWYGNLLQLELNPGLVTIIGNKGSGKSALAEVIGLDGSSRNMDYASFLSKKRFNNNSKYGARFSSCLQWRDGIQDDWVKLNYKINSQNDRVEFLPQNFIEKIASSVNDTELNTEIKKIVFNALPISKRLGQRSWAALIKKIEQGNDTRILDARTKIHSLNLTIIDLEDKLKPSFLNKKRDQLNEIESQIKSLEDNPPKEPTIENMQSNETKKIIELSDELAKNKDEKEKIENEQATLNKFFLELEGFQTRFDQLEKKVDEYNSTVNNFIDEYSPSFKLFNNTQLLNSLSVSINTSQNRSTIIEKYIEDSNRRKNELSEKSKHLSDIINEKTEKIKEYKSKMTFQGKKQSQYSEDLEKWKSKLSILRTGNQKSDCISKSSLNTEINKVINELPKEINRLYSQRNSLVKTILGLIKSKGDQLNDLYLDAKQDIDALNKVDEQSPDEPDHGVEFISSIQPESGYVEEILGNIDSRKGGELRGAQEAANFIKSQLEKINLSNQEEIISFIETVLYQNKGKSILKEQPNFDDLDGIYRNHEALYDYMYGLHFLDTELRLTYNGHTLQELSAGEKGLVLLIFYLGLSQKELPLVIDQPEDNLDNQSIFKHLVPYLRYAKTKRQIIVVTHNPNIAIAADADQVIVANMDKKNNYFSYESGALEEEKINEQIVDVLEGTKPAFKLRDRRYFLFE